VHFETPLNFLDLFLPINITSASRARAFLWLMFHYLEGPDLPNPFEDEYSRQHPGKVPWLHRINETEMQGENIDTEEEIQWGITMSGQRDAFLQRLMTSIDAEKKAKPLATVNPTKGSFLPSSLLSATHSNDRAISEVNYHRLRQRHLPNGEREKPFLHYVPPTREQQQQQAEPERRRGLLPSPFCDMTYVLHHNQIMPHDLLALGGVTAVHRFRVQSDVIYCNVCLLFCNSSVYLLSCRCVASRFNCGSTGRFGRRNGR
jgi:Ino eighty subunit 1